MSLMKIRDLELVSPHEPLPKGSLRFRYIFLAIGFSLFLNCPSFIKLINNFDEKSVITRYDV